MTDATPDLTTTSGRIADLRARLSEAQAPLGQDIVEEIHAAGSRTARERAVALFDEGTFVETDALARHRVTEGDMERNRPATDGVVTGYGTVDGRRVCVYSQDDSIFEGALGEVYGEKILKIYDLAAKTGVPVVGIHSSTGTRVIEGIAALNMYAKLFEAASLVSGLVPQISVITGRNVGLGSVAPAFADLVVQVEGSSLNLVDEDVVSSVGGTATTGPELGGAQVHSTTTGLAHLTAATDSDAIALVREVLSYLPVNNLSEAPRTGEQASTELRDLDRELDNLIPDTDAQAYDVIDVLTRIVDDGVLRQVQENFAPNVVTGFARVEGRAVGIVANQPTELAGCLDAAAATKAARFIRLCDAFNLAIIEVVDSPGFLPAIEQEHAGVTRSAAQLAYAYSEATVGKITLITRKALGIAYVVMGSKSAGADLVYAWPTAQIAAADAITATTALHGDDAKAEDWAADNLTPYLAAESGLVDTVIEPSATRSHLVEGLRLLDRKVITRRPKKHGNIPL